MRKVRIEELQEWFDDPETELDNFMNSGQAIMSIVFDGNRLVELNQRDVANLLIEIRARRDWGCGYCFNINSGRDAECVGCGAERK